MYRSDQEKQEHYVEIYLKLLTTALEDDYFICDYNAKYSVATQNEMFESCCNVYPFLFTFFVLKYILHLSLSVFQIEHLLQK